MGMRNNVRDGWDRTLRQRGGTRREPSSPNLLFTFWKAMEAERLHESHYGLNQLSAKPHSFFILCILGPMKAWRRLLMCFANC